MSFVADFIGGALDAVGGALDAVGEAVGGVLDGMGDNPLATLAAIALAVVTSGASVAADAAAYATASAAAETVAIDAWATVAAESVVAPSTWAAFGTEASTAGLFADATAAAVNTSVADYAAAAAAGEATGAATAFSMLPVSSMGPAVSAGFLDTALEAARGVKKAVDTVQIVNRVTQQKSIVPRNAPVPADWAVDSRWSPSLGDTGGKFVYDPATGALVMQPTAAPAAGSGDVMPDASTPPSLYVIGAALLAVFFYLAKS